MKYLGFVLCMYFEKMSIFPSGLPFAPCYVFVIIRASNNLDVESALLEENEASVPSVVVPLARLTVTPAALSPLPKISKTASELKGTLGFSIDLVK